MRRSSRKAWTSLLNVLDGNTMILPIDNKVLIKVIEEDETTTSGIVITTKENKAPTTREVIEIGSSVQTVKKGDRVFFGSARGDDVLFEGVHYKIFSEHDIIARYE